MGRLVYVGFCWRCPGPEKEKPEVQLFPDPYDDNMNLAFGVCIKCYIERSVKREWREAYGTQSW